MLIEIKNLEFVYNIGTPFEKKALQGINLQIEEYETVAIVGQVGAGKTTFVLHLNGLLKATKGIVKVLGIDLTRRGANLNYLRKIVGIVFQNPLHHLFEKTVFEDIAFGLKNAGLDEKIEKVREVLELVGLNYEEFKDRSPFSLSFGEMKRVALSGVLIMNPRVLILDDIFSGLDFFGKEKIKDIINKYRSDRNTTLILTSNDLENVIEIADKIFIIKDGKILLSGTPPHILKYQDVLDEVGVGVPEISKLMFFLNSKGHNVDISAFKFEDARKEILRMKGG